MEKPLRQYIGYKGISPLENALLSAVSPSGMPVFGAREARRLTGFGGATVNNLLASLVRKRLVLRLMRDKYCIADTLPEKNFAVAAAAFAPSYVSFWSALSLHGFTEQQPRAVQLASVKQFKPVKFGGISIHAITLKPRNFFGYSNERGFPLALKEKALIDSAVDFENAGGFAEFAKCLGNAWGELDKGRFVEFLLRMGNRSLNSRIGWLISELRLPLGKALAEKIRRKRSTGFVRLNPFKPAGGRPRKYGREWNIIINDSAGGDEVI
ncbi:hypothetical protein KKH30_01340 [Candidatus Micrarchaeota archaeon]|nr:hypothetical protein [Candidatus Micrarchaeota archaeon]MBU1939385.1 hypothetical protein [Candidatus Micrarchaeota archaeon]